MSDGAAWRKQNAIVLNLDRVAMPQCDALKHFKALAMGARIYMPARTATQSGIARSKMWILEFDAESARDVEPLMGWTSSGDMKSQIRLKFATKDEAIAYAKRNGLAYRVEEPSFATRKIQSYSDNFKSSRLNQWTH